MALIDIGLGAESWMLDDVSEDESLVLEIQRRLKVWNYDPGTPDADWGQSTQRAFANFTKAFKLSGDELSPAVARQLLKNPPMPVKTPAPVATIPTPVSVKPPTIGTPPGSGVAPSTGNPPTSSQPPVSKAPLPAVPTLPKTLREFGDQFLNWSIDRIKGNPALVTEIQTRLIAWNQGPGLADGAWGAKTQTAYELFAKGSQFKLDSMSAETAKRLLQSPPIVVVPPIAIVPPVVDKPIVVPPTVVPPIAIVLPVVVAPVVAPVVVSPEVPTPDNLRAIVKGTNTIPLTQIIASPALTRELQLSLDLLGHNPGTADGAWGQRTQRAYESFSRAFKADATVVSPRAAKLLIEPEIPGIVVSLPAPKKLDQADYERVAKSIGCDVAAVKAVVDVEAAGSGFYSDGRPKILFEAHWFSDFTNGRYDDTFPSISSAVWNRSLYIGGVGEWDRIYRAVNLDRASALKSASWGLGQIMGDNYGVCGYQDVETFIKDMHESEGKQLQAMFGFIKSNGLATALIRQDWATFAQGYNGESYRENAYDEKLADAYSYWKR